MLEPIKDTLEIGPNCSERFIEMSILAELEGLQVTLAGCSNLSGRYQVARTFPLEHTLFYTVSGQGRLLTSQDEFVLTANSLAILPATKAFSVSIDSAHWDIIWINLANVARWQHLLCNQATVLANQRLASLHFAMEILFSESNPKLRDGALPLVSHYINQMLQSKQQNHPHQRIYDLFHEIEKRLQFDWNILEMCKRAHYSPPHLHRLCQVSFGRSPMQQLIHLRIKRAKSLLLSTRWSISHIASYTGYSNVFNFSKRFKKSTGVSPSEFRKHNR